MLCVAVPAPCGDKRYDAAIAGLVEHYLTKDRPQFQSGLTIPGASWFSPGRHLSTPSDRRFPDALARHGVWLSESDLASV